MDETELVERMCVTVAFQARSLRTLVLRLFERHLPYQDVLSLVRQVELDASSGFECLTQTPHMEAVCADVLDGLMRLQAEAVERQVGGEKAP